jgi:hypothetical protein
MMIKLRNGRTVLLRPVALHRRHRRGTYKRPTDWLVQVGSTIVWARTRTEVIQELKRKLGLHLQVIKP